MEGDMRWREMASRGPCAGIRRKIRHPKFFSPVIASDDGGKQTQTKQTARSGSVWWNTARCTEGDSKGHLAACTESILYLNERQRLQVCLFFVFLFFSFPPALQMWLILPDDTHSSGVKGSRGKRRKSLWVFCQGLILSQIRSVQWCSWARLITQAGLAEVFWTLWFNAETFWKCW